MGHDIQNSTFIGNIISCIITFFAVTIAWVFFRANDFDTAINILATMMGFDENAKLCAHLFTKDKKDIIIWLVSLSAIVWLFPNVSEWMNYSLDDTTTKPKPSILQHAYSRSCSNQQ